MDCAMPKSNISADLPGLPVLLVINLSQPKTDGAIRQAGVLGKLARYRKKCIIFWIELHVKMRTLKMYFSYLIGQCTITPTRK